MGKTDPPDSGGMVDGATTQSISSIGMELFSRLNKRMTGSAVQLAPTSDWLISLAVGGIRENFSFRALAELADEIKRSHADPTLDLPAVVDPDDYDELRAREHRERAIVDLLTPEFRIRHETAYVRTARPTKGG